MNTIEVQNTKKSEKTLPYKATVYNEFVIWYSMPLNEKEKCGIETMGQFSQYYKVSKDTLTNWKNRPDFQARTDKLIMDMGHAKTADVVQGMYKAAVKGNPMSQMLWLQFFKKFNPKGEQENESKQIQITVDDIRFLIEALPEPLKTKHYDNLRQLLDDSAAIAHAIDDGEIPDNLRTIASRHWDEGFEDTISVETNNDAQHVQVERTHAIPRSYPQSVCTDMERQVSPRDHQSSAWRG